MLFVDKRVLEGPCCMDTDPYNKPCLLMHAQPNSLNMPAVYTSN